MKKHERIMPKKAIVISIPWELYKKGGVNTVVKGLLEQFCSNEMELTCVLHINNWQQGLDYDENHSYSVIRIPTTSWSCCKGFYNKLKFLIYQMPRMYVMWYLAIKKHNICAINVHFPTPNSLAFILIGKLFRLKKIYTFHGTDIDQFHETAPKCQKNLVAERADHVIVSSRSSQERLCIKNPLYADKVTIIPNGVNIEKIKQSIMLDRKDLIVQKPYFINIATYEPQKGQDILLKAFSQLCNVLDNFEHKLVFVGRSTPHLNVLKQLANELEINDRVLFYSDLKHYETMTLLSSAELFLLASRQEAFGIVLIEAGALEVPIMAHAVGGITEIITPNLDGILVNENTTEEWEKKLRSFMSRQNEHKELVDHFLKKINKKYGNKNVVNSYIKLV